VKSADELGTLAEGFNQMTAQLRSVTVSRDDLQAEISEREKAEEAMRESENQYRSLFEGAPDALFIADPETGIITAANEAASLMTGRSRSELIGMHQTELHPPKMREYAAKTFLLQLEDARKNRLGSAVEHEVIHLDGSIIPVEIITQMVTVGGRPALQGVFRDITARKIAQKKLQAEAEINEMISELASDVLMAESIEAISVIILKGAQKITGSRFGYVGYIDSATGYLICPTMTHDIWDKCGVSGKSIVFERHAGLFGWVLKNRKPLLTNDPAKDERSTRVPEGHIPIEKFISVPAMHGDILIGQLSLANAERDYTDEDLVTLERISLIFSLGIRRRQAEESLEQRVADRTTDLQKKSRELQESQYALMNIVEDLNLKTSELNDANKKLQELDRLKSMFIASMSHELRTPLNSIIGFSSILLNEWVGRLTDEQRENLAIILRSGKHLLSLINDVIDVSKIEAGIFESKAEDFDLYDLISEAVSSLSREARDKGLELKGEALHLMMHTDRRRSLQCLLNLLSNAVKFTERGSVRVSARIEGQEKEGQGSRIKGQGEEDSSLLLATWDLPLDTDFVEISVEDTGIGIDGADIPKLFGPFVRIDSHLRSLVPGTGLGLYLAKKLVTEVLKGDIICVSSPGEGSRFIMRIPVNI